MRKAFKWLLPAAGLGIIALGVATIFTPIAGIVVLAIFFGIAMLVSGISEIVSFAGAEKSSRSGMLLASGILSTLFGIWVMFGRGIYAIAIILPFIFAVWVMASGITRIVDSVSRKPEGSKMRTGALVIGILTSLSGFALLFNPILSAGIVAFIVPFMLIFHGIGTIQLFFLLLKAEKQSSNG
ncbi:MAG: DUF308 domain-containing protein [Treponema sp.]|nr:DUF308 domain-containing protein [Treponema sp.]